MKFCYSRIPEKLLRVPNILAGIEWGMFNGSILGLHLLKSSLTTLRRKITGYNSSFLSENWENSFKKWRIS